jgi:hypothetical protein
VTAVRSHFQAIEADWARVYNRDLGADLYGPNRIGARKILSLVEWLPPDAAVWRSMKNSWTDERELLATQIEVLDGLRRAFLMAHSKPGTRPPEPIRIPRPWQTGDKGKKRGTRLNDLIREMRLPVRHDTGKEGQHNGA